MDNCRLPLNTTWSAVVKRPERMRGAHSPRTMPESGKKLALLKSKCVISRPHSLASYFSPIQKGYRSHNRTNPTTMYRNFGAACHSSSFNWGAGEELATPDISPKRAITLRYQLRGLPAD